MGLRARAFWGALLLAFPAFAQPVPIIPRAQLFAEADVADPKLSPDGKLVGWKGVDARGVLQLWVQPMPVGQSTQVTQGPASVDEWAWSEDSGTLLYLQEADRGSKHLFSIDLGSKEGRDLTPGESVIARLLGSSGKVPDQFLAAVNLRDQRAFDVHRFNLKTNSSELDTRNPGDVVAWAWDESLAVRAALARLPDGGAEVRVREGVKQPWRSLVKVSAHENLSLLGFSLDGKGVYLATSVASDTTRVVEKNLKTGSERILAAAPGSDLRAWLYNPWKMAVQAAAFERGGKLEWTPIETSVFRDLELLTATTAGSVFRVISRDRADALWLVEVQSDRAAPKTLLWDRGSKKGSAVFAAFPLLEGKKLAETKVVGLTARDGTPLSGLLTLPAGLAAAKLPLVLVVKERAADPAVWGFDPLTQFFSNRNYAVLQLNFRGSTGFGKKLQNLGNREWGRRMQDDLVDAVAWAVKEGVADPKKVAIVGAFYGGYAALMGVALTPDTFKCAASVFPAADLPAWVKSAVPLEKALEGDWERRMGDLSSAADKARLEQASPSALADRIQAPLLLVPLPLPSQKKAAVALAARVEKRGVPVTTVNYDGVARSEDWLDYTARLEAFLARCLGGRAEPMPKK